MGPASKLVVAELSADDATSGAIAEHLAARQIELCSKFAGVARRYQSTDAARELVPDLNSGSGGFGAWRNGRLVGFLHGTSNGAFGFVPSTHHGLDPSEADPTDVYGQMYAALAVRWLSDGVTVHDVEVPAIDVLEQAWFDLGFGRRTCFATRDIGSSSEGGSTDADIRVATEEDLPEIVRLALLEAQFRAAPPLFAEQGPLDSAVFLAQHRQLASAGGAHLLARCQGKDVGFLTIEPRSPAVLLTADDAPFIGPTGVEPAARGQGIGHELVAAAVKWARAHDQRWMSVSFNPSNLMSRPFWRGCGFDPTGWKVARRLPVEQP
ncbi:MAG: GNAT family N-acetyltransferase [Ilumatobacteraceae bacterium]